MAGHTAAYDEFMHSFNGGLEYKDDLDLDAYGRCTPTEKAELDRLLEKKLPEGDPRVARAIANLWPEEKATAVLSSALGKSKGDAQLGIAVALRSVSDAAALDALRQTLFNEAASTDSRISAAVALGQIDGAPANFSLKAALDEPVPELQRRAAELLFHKLKLDEHAAASNSGAAVLQKLLRHNDEAVRGAAIAELKRVVDSGSAAMAGYGGGATPPALADLIARAGQ